MGEQEDGGSVAVTVAGPGAPPGNYSGVWLSHYEFYSSSRDTTFTDDRYVVLEQVADRISVRSLAGSAPSNVTMDLTIDRDVITGTWAEHTDPDGFYRGAVYHGAIQLVADPAGQRMAGKWVGFGKDGDVNTGPWALAFVDASTSQETLARYDQPVAEE